MKQVRMVHEANHSLIYRKMNQTALACQICKTHTDIPLQPDYCIEVVPYTLLQIS